MSTEPTYLKDGDLPKDHLALYEKGCRILCEESSESRRAAGKKGRLSPDQRLAIASRIAAVTQLCKRFAVYTGPEADGVPPEDVLIGDLAGGFERAGDDDVEVSESALWEVLGTGLFSSRGADRLGWAHLTYAEFLAARYCTRRKMPVAQMRPLLFHPSDQGRRLIPQLHEVAAWISVMDPEILKAVAGSDPEALLGAAAASLSDDQRHLIVDSLLQASEGRMLHLRPEFFWVFGKLKHPQLPDQLRPYVTDANRPIGTRHVAISIARACDVEELGPDLADLALNESADAGLRSSAAATVAGLTSQVVKDRLRPLAFGEAGEDSNDELKGSGLRAIWPESLTASELFSLLTERKDRHLSGTYSRFMYDDVIQKASPRDLPVALEWFAKQGSRRDLIGPIDYLMDRIFEFAWDNLDQPGVASGLAAAIVSRLRIYDELFSNDHNREFANKVQNDQERRRTLLKALFPQLNEYGLTGLITSHVLPLVASSDVEWLIDRALSGEANETALVEAKLVRFGIHSESGEKVLAKLWHACQTNEALNAECGAWFQPIELDSELARLLREELKQRNEWKTPKLVTPPPSERIENDLQKSEAGNAEYGAQLMLDLTLEPTSSHYAFDATADLTDTPGWKAADSPTRKRILDAAVRYLQDGDPQNDQWFRTNSTPFTAIAGFRALALLMITEDTRLDSLSLDTWAKWVPIMLKSHPGAKGELQFQSRLLKRAQQLVPGEIVKRILELIDAENELDRHLFIADQADICWDENLGAALLEKSKSAALKPQILGSILEILLNHGFSGAREFAETLMETKASGSELEQRQAVIAAQTLLRWTPDASWAKVWPIIRDGEIGRGIIESTSYGQSGIPNFVTKLSEADLGELYLWMIETYPPVERIHGGFGFMGPGDTAVMFRDGLLEYLTRRGTFAATDAIRRVMRKVPQCGWLRRNLDEADALARANTWRPVSIREFLALARDRDKRFVDSGSQLIETIIESLDRLAATLHDELSAVRDFWNTREGEISPKDEGEVADRVVRYLREDLKGRGIIVNREVQIRRGIGGRTGQRTDIHVDAVSPGKRDGDGDTIYAIVEVKGNWNAELLSAMKTQLLDRYLKEIGSPYGLYLVAWFACAKWNDGDSRKTKCSPMQLSEAREFFSRQAIELSKDGSFIRSYVLDLLLSS